MRWEVLRSVFSEFNRWGGYREREGRYSASCRPTGYPPRVNFRNHIACQESLLQVSRIRACSGHVVASCRCTITCDRYNVTVKMPLHTGSATGVTDSLHICHSSNGSRTAGWRGTRHVGVSCETTSYVGRGLAHELWGEMRTGERRREVHTHACEQNSST